jgi:hypothetical protein
MLNLIWPRSRKDYSVRAAAGRLLLVAFVVIGAIPVIFELAYWHGRWDHLATYFAMWLAISIIGRLVRLVLSRE